MYNNNNINLPSFLNADSLILSENSETRRKKSAAHKECLFIYITVAIQCPVRLTFGYFFLVSTLV